MYKLLIDIFIFIFEGFVFYFYSDKIFVSHLKNSTKLLYIIFVHAILGIVYQFDMVILNSILILLFYVFLYVKIYETNIKKSIFHTFILLAILLATEFSSIGLSTLLFDNYNSYLDDINAYTFSVILSKLLYFIVILFVVKHFEAKEQNTVQDKIYWMLFILPLTTLFVILFIRYLFYINHFSIFISLLSVIISFLLLFSNIIVFVIYSKSINNILEINKLKTMRMQQKIDEKYFNVLEKAIRDTKFLTHDMKNHLVQIKYMDNIEQVHLYVDTLIPTIENINFICNSENKTLNIIISKYTALCEKKHIKFTFKIEGTNLLYFNDIDLASLLNNLLDNSVDAAENVNDSIIDIKIFSKNESFDGIFIKNSCKDEPVYENNKLQTKKENKELHGTGLSIVKSIVDKYDIIYEWKYNSELKLFETFLVIPKQTK